MAPPQNVEVENTAVKLGFSPLKSDRINGFRRSLACKLRSWGYSCCLHTNFALICEGSWPTNP